MNAARHRDSLAGFAFAVAAIVVLAWFELATWPLFRMTPFLPLSAGVVLAALVAGPLPGLLATILGALATTLIPRPTPPPTGPQSYVPMFAFLAIGIAVSVLSFGRHASRSRIRRILEGVSDSCALLGRDWKYIFVNRAAATMVGRHPDQLAGSEISEVFPHVAELPTLREVRRAMDSGIPGRIETFYAPLGKWFETNLYPMEEGVTIIARDVTERRQAEEALRESERRLRAIFDQAIAGIAQTDPEGRFLHVNERFCEIVGRSAAELSALRIQDITHPDDLPRSAAVFDQLMRGGENFVLEKRYVRPNGSPVWVRKQVSAVRDPNGTPVYGFAIVEEITERKRAEVEKDEALRRERSARGEAESANRSKDEFLAVVSHELRTPLTAMLGWLRLMKMGAVDTSPTSRGIEAVERNADLLVRLVEDLLDVSRIISGKLELDLHAVPVAGIVRSAIETVRPATEAKQINLRARLGPDPGLVAADPARLQQVVWNLLANATKFTPPGGQIDVTLERRDGHIAIDVTDTGIGIASEFLPRVFERFRQADSSQSRKHAGLGLGLAIVRHVVEMHGGTVQAESEGEGRGARFTVILPVHVLKEPRKTEDSREKGYDRTQTSPKARENSVPTLQGVRVLLVEDDVDTRSVIERILAWRGADVRACASAVEARSSFRSWKPDVVVSDIGMPEESGYSLIASLRALEHKRGGHVPAIALTAYAHDANRVQALTAGYDAHVSKPVEPADLIRAVVEVRARVLQTAPPETKGRNRWGAGSNGGPKVTPASRAATSRPRQPPP